MARVETRERKRISIKSALRGHLATLTGAAAAAVVESYSKACFMAYVGSLPCRTGLTQFSSQIALQGWPGEITGEVLRSSKRDSPIVEHKTFDPSNMSLRESTKGVFVDDYRVKEARTAAGSGDPYSVQVKIAVKPGFARRMIMAAQPGSRSKIRDLKLIMWARRAAYDEPISQIILQHEGIDNFMLTPFGDGDTRPREPFATLLPHFMTDINNAFYQKALREARKVSDV